MYTYFDVSHLTDEFKAEKVSEYLGYVVDDRSDAEKRRRSTVILNNDIIQLLLRYRRPSATIRANDMIHSCQRRLSGKINVEDGPRIIEI